LIEPVLLCSEFAEDQLHYLTSIFVRLGRQTTVWYSAMPNYQVCESALSYTFEVKCVLT
jgi:hypothetical protein